MAIVVALGAWLGWRDGGQGLVTLGGGQLVPAVSYSLIDEDSIAITATSGQGRWTRITNVIEGPTEVRIEIRALSGPGTYTDVGYPVTWTVQLRDPLGNRVVHDGYQRVRLQLGLSDGLAETALGLGAHHVTRL